MYTFHFVCAPVCDISLLFHLASSLPPAPSATSPWRQAGAHSAVAVPGAVPAYEEQVPWDYWKLLEEVSYMYFPSLWRLSIFDQLCRLELPYLFK